MFALQAPPNTLIPSQWPLIVQASQWPLIVQVTTLLLFLLDFLVLRTVCRVRFTIHAILRVYQICSDYPLLAKQAYSVAFASLLPFAEIYNAIGIL